MSIITFWDTETTGLIEFKKPNNHPSQPHLVQLACLMIDLDDLTLESKVLGKTSLIVKSPVESGEKALAAHGITHEMSSSLGVNPESATRLWNHFRDRSDLMVAHNKSFDMRVMEIQMSRYNPEYRPFAGIEHSCTMQMATSIVKCPPTEKMIAAGMGKRFKSPSLSECYRHFFYEHLEGAHDAMVDTEACARVYLHIRKRQAMQES